MLKSMTGFGRHEITDEKRKIVVELKSVNHRYCDISIKMPKKIGFFESGIRSLLKSYIGRGKIDVFILYEEYMENEVFIKYHKDTAGEYLACLRQLGEDFLLDNDITVSVLSRFPEVFTLEEQSFDEQRIWSVMEQTVKCAAEKFVETRVAEGERLKRDVMDKLDGMLEKITLIEERSPQVVAEYRQKISNKVKELLGDNRLDEGILVTELTVFAEKICVDEEVVRLKSHIISMEKTLEEAENVGRKLDFIAQEMNREANTILSKANDLKISDYAIDLKTEIEKVREQIQNIE